jgi:hypothetical protein
MCDVFPFSQFYFGQAKQALELHEHRAAHGPDATLGPMGPIGTGHQRLELTMMIKESPEPLPVKRSTTKVDRITSEALAPLWHEGSPRNQTGGPNTEV